jgi:hypothetical protein
MLRRTISACLVEGNAFNVHDTLSRFLQNVEAFEDGDFADHALLPSTTRLRVDLYSPPVASDIFDLNEEQYLAALSFIQFDLTIYSSCLFQLISSRNHVSTFRSD